MKSQLSLGPYLRDVWTDIRPRTIRPQKYSIKYHIKISVLRMECDHLLVDDEVEYLYKGKSYCDDCYRAVKKIVTEGSNENEKSYGKKGSTIGIIVLFSFLTIPPY